LIGGKRLYPDQAKALGVRNRLRPSVDGELYENVLDVRFHRFRSDTQGIVTSPLGLPSVTFSRNHR
jgi:hypothetical protein